MTIGYNDNNNVAILTKCIFRHPPHNTKLHAKFEGRSKFFISNFAWFVQRIALITLAAKQVQPAQKVLYITILWIITLVKSKSRPRVSTNLGWDTVPPSLKCLPFHKFKKEWKSYLLTNQIWPCLYVLSLILSEILFPLFTAADYLNMTVSNKKALASLDTVYKWT